MSLSALATFLALAITGGVLNEDASAAQAGKPNPPIEMVDASKDSIMYKATLQSFIDCYKYASLSSFQMRDYWSFAGDADMDSAQEIFYDEASGSFISEEGDSVYQISNPSAIQSAEGGQYWTLSGVDVDDYGFYASFTTPVISSDPRALIWNGGGYFSNFDTCLQANGGTATENRGRNIQRSFCWGNAGDQSQMYMGRSFAVPSILSGLNFKPNPDGLYNKEATTADYSFYGMHKTYRTERFATGEKEVYGSNITNGTAHYPQMMAPGVNILGSNKDFKDDDIEYDTAYLCQDFFWHEDGSGTGDEGFWGLLNREKYGGALLSESGGKIPTNQYQDLLTAAKFLQKMGYVFTPGDSAKQCIRFKFVKRTYELHGVGVPWLGGEAGDRRYEYQPQLDKEVWTDYVCVRVNDVAVVSEPTIEKFDNGDASLPSGLIKFEIQSAGQGGGLKITCSDGEKNAAIPKRNNCGDTVVLKKGDDAAIEGDVEGEISGSVTMSALQSQMNDLFAGFEAANESFGTWFNNNEHMFNLAHNGDHEYVYAYQEAYVKQSDLVLGSSGEMDLTTNIQESDQSLVTGYFTQLQEDPEKAAVFAFNNLLGADATSYAQRMGVSLTADTTISPAERYILYRKYLLKYYNFDNTMFCEPLENDVEGQYKTDMMKNPRPSAGASQDDWDAYYTELQDRGIREEFYPVTKPDGTPDESKKYHYWNVVCREDNGKPMHDKVMTDNGCVDKSEIKWTDDDGEVHQVFSDSSSEGEFGDYEEIVLYLDGSDDVPGNQAEPGFRRCYFNMRDGSVMLDRYVYGVRPEGSGYRFFEAQTIDDVLEALIAPNLNGPAHKVDPEHADGEISAVTEGYSEFYTAMIDPIEDTDGYTRSANCWHGAVAAGMKDTDGAGFFGWFVCPIIDKLGSAVRGLYDTVLVNILEFGSDIIENQHVMQAWSSVLDLANILITVFVLIMIFSQMSGYGMSHYGVKAMLPRLIVGALIVNLSFYVCQICIDISTIMAGVIKSASIAIVNNTAASLFGTANMNFPVEDSPTLSVGPTLAFAGIAAVIIGAVIISKGAIFIPIITAFIGVVVSLIGLLVVLSMRYALVIALVIVSPLAFACALLPNTKKAFQRWFGLFKGVLIVYPVCSALVYGADMAAKLVLFSWMSDAHTLESGIGFNEAIFLVSVAVMDVAPIFMLPAAVKKCLAAASGMVGAISQFASRSSRTVQRGARTVANRSALGRGAALYKERRQDAYRSKLTRSNAFRARMNQRVRGAFSSAGRAVANSGVGRKASAGLQAVHGSKVANSFRRLGTKISEAPVIGAVVNKAAGAANEAKATRRDARIQRQFFDQNQINRLEALEAKNARAYKAYRQGKPANQGIEGAKDPGQIYLENAFSRNGVNRGMADVGLEIVNESGKPSKMLTALSSAVTTENVRNLDDKQRRSLARKIASTGKDSLAGAYYGYYLLSDTGTSSDDIPDGDKNDMKGFDQYMIEDFANTTKREMSRDALVKADDDAIEWLAQHGRGKADTDAGRQKRIASGADMERSFLSDFGDDQIAAVIANGSQKQRNALGDLRETFGKDRMKEIARSLTVDQVADLDARQLDMFAMDTGKPDDTDEFIRDALRDKIEAIRSNPEQLDRMNSDVRARLFKEDNNDNSNNG